MTDLLNIQRNFASHLQKESDKKIVPKISGSRLEAEARLNIYRNNVYGGFEAVLIGKFSQTIKILGAKKFAKLLKKFCQEFPSKSGDLDDFGVDFPKFISRIRPAFLKDLAQLELLHHQAYFAKKVLKKFDVKKLQKLPTQKVGELYFYLDPSCFLFSSKYAVCSIWQNLENTKNPENPESALIQSEDILKISEEELLFLSLIKKQKKLYEIYQIMSKKNKNVDIGDLLKRFIANGTISDYSKSNKYA
jgi:hypothetical protein